MSEVRQNPSERENAFAVLRRFARRRNFEEQCELCSAELATEHSHLLEPATRKIRCACQPCSILFSGQAGRRYLLIPRRSHLLSGFDISDEQWAALLIPINLAFFYREGESGRIVAMYPSPAGATESLLTLDSWQEIAAENQALQEMQPDVEALLVNRVGACRDYFLAPMDECYRLVGIIRMQWRGLSGGPDVWTGIQDFFSQLKRQTVGRREAFGA